MLILALESSAKPGSCAVLSDEELLGQYFQNNGLTHSRTLLSMTESLIKNLELDIADIDLIAVSRGPGSFTGVRIGVSAAKGLAWGIDKPVCGVSTLEAIAYGIPQHGAILCPVMDARRGQVYNALFEFKDGKPVRLCEDRAISLQDFASELRELNQPCILSGDGAEISFDYLSGVDVRCDMAPVPMRRQTAYGVALAASNAVPIPAVELEPSYLRPSQAERERMENER